MDMKNVIPRHCKTSLIFLAALGILVSLWILQSTHHTLISWLHICFNSWNSSIYAQYWHIIYMSSYLSSLYFCSVCRLYTCLVQSSFPILEGSTLGCSVIGLGPYWWLFLFLSLLNLEALAVRCCVN